MGRQLVRIARAGAPVSQKACARLAEPDEAFAWLVEAARIHLDSAWAVLARDLAKIPELRDLPAPAPRGPTARFQVYVGDAIPIYEAPFLPREEDHDLHGYLARVSRASGGREVGCQVPYLQAAGWDAFRRFLEVIGPSLDVLGPRRTRFTCFFGNYARTPFGPHLDAHHRHVFQYVVSGRRTLRVWDTREVLRSRGVELLRDLDLDALGHAHRLPRTRKITAGPGDLLYWPGDRLHCIESDGPSIGISIVFERDPWTATSATSPPHEHLAALSGKIFDAVPARTAPPPLSATTVLASRLTRHFPILHAKAGAALHVAVHGYTATWTDARSRDRVVRLLADLNRKGRVRVGDALAPFGRGSGRELVRELLEFLVSAGAFRVVPE